MTEAHGWMPRALESRGLAGQVAFVTGGATGIGLAVVAARWPRAGARWRSSRATLERAEAAVAAIRGSGEGAAHACSAPTSRAPSRWTRRSPARSTQLRRVDMLVNNAGLTRDGLFMRMSDEQWNEVLDTNLDGRLPLLPRGGARA